MWRETNSSCFSSVASGDCGSRSFLGRFPANLDDYVSFPRKREPSVFASQAAGSPLSRWHLESKPGVDVPPRLTSARRRSACRRPRRAARRSSARYRPASVEHPRREGVRVDLSGCSTSAAFAVITTRDRRVNVGRSLDRLDHRARLALAATLRPTSGSSTNTTSPSASWANSVMPTVGCRRPRAHPLVRRGVLQLSGHGHGNSLQEKDW